MMHHGGSMPEIWEMLPEDQKRKIIAMKLEMKLLWMQLKIDETQRMIELKKKSMANIKYVHDMILQGGQQAGGQQAGGQQGGQQAGGQQGGQQAGGQQGGQQAGGQQGGQQAGGQQGGQQAGGQQGGQ